MNITLKIATYAAIVSTITALVQLFNYHRDKAKVKVRMSFLHKVNMYDKSNMPPASIIRIHVANTGRRPVTIIECYVKAGDLRIPSNAEPSSLQEAEIGEGKAHVYELENTNIDKFGLTSEDLCAFALDATFKCYWSDPIVIRWIKATRCNKKMGN